MSGNDWNNLGRDVKNIVQNAIDTGDFGRLNRDLGQTLESALGNVAQSMKNAGNMAGQYRYRGQQGMNQPYGQDKEPKPYGPGNGYSTNYRYRPFGHYRSPASSERVKEAREEFALFVNTGSAKAMGILLTTLGIALTIMFGATAAGFIIASLFVHTVAVKLGTILAVFGTATALSLIMAVCGNHLRKKIKRFRTYVKTLNGKPYGSIRELAKSVRKSEKFVRRDLKKMINKRMFLEGHLDAKGFLRMWFVRYSRRHFSGGKNRRPRKRNLLPKRHGSHGTGDTEALRNTDRYSDGETGCTGRLAEGD